jgi:pyruvate carboxylase
VLKDEKPITDRPGKHVPPVDLEKPRAEVASKLDTEIDDEDLMGYLMYPKVFTDYATRHKEYGPVRTLPTRTFFYGMEPGEEIEAEIDPGKTLVVQLQAWARPTRTARSGLLRTERPAPHDPRAQPQGRRTQAKRPKAELGNPQPYRRTDARRGGHGRGFSRARRCNRATCC